MKTLKTLLMALVAVVFCTHVDAQCVSTNEDDLTDLCVTATETGNAAPTPAGTFDVWDGGTMAAGMDGTDDVSLTMEAVVFTPNANGTCDDGDFTITGCVGPTGPDWSATTSDDCYCTNGYVCITVDMINGFSSEASGLDFPFTSVNGSTEGHEAIFAYVTAGTDANGGAITLPMVDLSLLNGFCEPEYNAGSVSAFVGATGPGTFAVDQNTGVTNDCATSGQSGEDTESGDNPNDNSDAQTVNPNWGLNATDLVTQYKIIYFFGNTPGTDCDADGDTGVGTNPSANFGALTFCPPVETVVVECGACTEGTAGLVITELSYDPAATQGNDGDCEYIEIFNSYSNAITTDASTTVTLSGGTTVNLPAGITIMPGEYIILTGPNFAGCTWATPPPAGTQIIDAGVAGTLSNAGEDVTITLACADDATAGNTQTVTFSDATTPNAGGGGSSVYYPLDGTGPLEGEPTPGSGDCTACAMTEYTCAMVACAIEADLMAAPAPPTVTESTCEADGMTLSGGVVDPITCPTGATAEYSIDGGTTWTTTVPMYDQTNTITVTVRCLCDEDMTTASPTAEVVTVPGVCTPVCDFALVPGTATCDAVTTDPDTYTATFTFTDADGMGTYTVTASAGTPDMTSITNTASGTVTVTGVTEGTNVTLTITDGADCDLMVTVPSPVCEPVVVCSITNVAFTQACTGTGEEYELCVTFDYADIGPSGTFNVYLDPAGTGTPATIVAGPILYTDYQTAIDGGAACFTVTGYVGDAADLEAGLEVCIGDADAPAPGTGLPPGSTPPPGGIPTFACPQIYGILHNACAPAGGDEGPNEFVVIVNGADPTPVSSIIVDTPSGSDYDDFNTVTPPASWTCPCCVYLDETGTIPAGGVVVATSAANVSTLDFTSLCGTAGTIYVLQDDGVGSTGHFSNSGPRTTLLNLSGTTGCDGSTSYTYTNSDGVDGDYTTFNSPDSPAYPAAGNNGIDNASTDVVNSSGDCTPQIAPAAEVECYACGTLDEVTCVVAAQCPPVAEVDAADAVCDGALMAEITDWQAAIAADATNTTAIADANTSAAVEYSSVIVDGAAVTAPDGVVADGVHSGADVCVAEDYTTYAYLLCFGVDGMQGTADDVYSLVGTHTLTVNPNTQTPAAPTPNGCMVTLAPTCPNDVLAVAATPNETGGASAANFDAATGVYTAQPGDAAGSIDITITNEFGCTPATVTLATPACNAACPVVTTPLATTEDICDGGAPALDDTALVIDDETLAVPAGAGVTVSWWTDAGLTTAFGGTVDYAMAGGDGCNTVDVTLYASIECDADNTVIAAGETTITIYPPYDAATLTITNADCTVATVVSSCANYVITPDPANPAAPAPGMMATFNFTIEYNGGPAGASCFSQVEMVNVNCPAAGCPSVVPVDATDAVCDGALAAEITTWQGNVEADATNTAAIADANTDAAVIYSTDAPAGVSEATPPTAGTATGVHSGADLCAAETEMTYAYLLCFGDDGVAGGGDDSYLALGMHTLTVYPLSQAPTIVDDPATCIVTITPACANDVLSQGTLDYNGAMAGALDVIGATAQNEFGCPAVTYDVTHGDCTVPMPSIMILKDDADNSDDTQEAVGGSATFTITIMNNGDEDLCNISLTDTPSDAGVVVTTCEPTFTSIDSNADGILAVGETETYTCTVTGITAAFTNTIAVTAEGCGSGTAVMDDDPTNVTVPMVCEDEIAGMVIGDPSCDLSGITVTITDDMGNIVTTLTTNSMGVYDSTPAVYPCGSYSAELTAGVPTCYGDGETGPKDFIIDGDTPMTDTDGPDFGTITSIPTVGEWGLIILALLMSIVAVAGIKQRNITIVKE